MANQLDFPPPSRRSRTGSAIPFPARAQTAEMRTGNKDTVPMDTAMNATDEPRFMGPRREAGCAPHNKCVAVSAFN